MSQRYDVHLAGFTPDAATTAVAGLGQAFGLSPEQARQFMASLPRIVRRRLSEADAQQTQVALAAIGGKASLRPSPLQAAPIVAVKGRPSLPAPTLDGPQVSGPNYAEPADHAPPSAIGVPIASAAIPPVDAGSQPTASPAATIPPNGSLRSAATLSLYQTAAPTPPPTAAVAPMPEGPQAGAQLAPHSAFVSPMVIGGQPGPESAKNTDEGSPLPTSQVAPPASTRGEADPFALPLAALAGNLPRPPLRSVAERAPDASLTPMQSPSMRPSRPAQQPAPSTGSLPLLAAATMPAAHRAVLGKMLAVMFGLASLFWMVGRALTL